MALYWPLGSNKKPSNLGSQFATLEANVPAFTNMVSDINVLAFINNLGQNNKPKMLKVGPKLFQL
jgi:hypothetical protein